MNTIVVPASIRLLPSSLVVFKLFRCLGPWKKNHIIVSWLVGSFGLSRVNDLDILPISLSSAFHESLNFSLRNLSRNREREENNWEVKMGKVVRACL
jgi:hypothetical protein